MGCNWRFIISPIIPLLTWDKNRKYISYSKAGRLYACALHFSYSPK